MTEGSRGGSEPDRLEQARRRYQHVLRAWPRRYRERYAEEMTDVFVTLLRMDSERAGPLGEARCWAGASVDAVTRGLGMRIKGMMGKHYDASAASNQTGGGEIMGSIISDVRYAVRSLGRKPVFALTAVLTIAIGIGANAAVFTIVDGFMLTPLPYDEPDELVALWSANPELGWSGTDVSHVDAWAWRDRSSTLADVTVFDGDGFNLTGGDTPELISGLRVTPNFFTVLGRQPVLGRDFEPEEIGQGQDRVVVLTDGFWARRFARDPEVLGTTLVLDGEPVSVIGVLGPDFLSHNDRVDLYRPWHFEMATGAPGDHSAKAIGRMMPGATVETVLQDLQAISRQLETEHEQHVGWTAEVVPLHEDVVGEVASQASVVLMAAVGFILVMACVNVANLLLARAGGRGREMAVRVALGASRRRVVRQLLTESVVLASIGGVLGLAGGVWGYRAIVAALPSTLPPVFQFTMDKSVLAFTATITIGAAILFGIVPAMNATADQGSLLRDGGRAGTSRSASRFSSALVVIQTAMAVVLLVGGGLLMKSVAGMRAQDFGFEPANVLTARIAPPPAEYDSREVAAAYWLDVSERIRSVPGVVAMGTTQSHPLMGSNWSRTVRIAGQDLAEDRSRTVRLTVASPGLFEALRFGMAQGRVFDASDASDAPNVAIVNEAFVERYLGPNDDPLSQTVLSGETWTASIVGVVHDVIERGVDRSPEPAMYLPMAQQDIRTRSIVMQAVGDPTAIVSAVQEAVWMVDAAIPVYSVQTMEALIDDEVRGFAVIGNLMGIFALLSLVLGAVGIYGVTAYAAGQRTSEIGVRLAMGAARTDVVAMVVRQGARRTVLGMVIGLALSMGMGSAMSGILVGVSPRDPLTFVAVTLMLSTVSFLGLYLPARRAAQVDPVRALASE